MESIRVDDILYSCKTKFQEVQIAKNSLGKTLYMDRKMQSCAFDEFVYHECLVHPAMLNVENVRPIVVRMYQVLYEQQPIIGSSYNLTCVHHLNSCVCRFV